MELRTPAFGQLVKSVRVACRQGQFLGVGPSFDLAFTARGGKAVRVFLDEDDLSSAEDAGCAAAFAAFVLGVTARRVVGLEWPTYRRPSFIRRT